jgi:multidrug efflux pump subunit AcrB
MTRLSDLSIRNPVFAVMLATALMLFGYLGYRDLGISQFPELDFPVVTVTTYRDAASPEVMDNDVTDVVEDAISGVEGIDYIQSQSSQGVSVVTVTFRLSRKVDAAMQDVQNAIAAAAARLPADIDPPIVTKMNFNKFPIIWLTIHGPRTLQELNRFVDDHLKKRVQTIPGVGGVIYGGLRVRTMRVWLDRDKLQSFNLDAFDVWQALREQQVEIPGGYLTGKTYEINVRFKGESQSAEEFRKVPIIQRDGRILRLEDVAVVEDGLADRRTFARFNGMTTVGMGVMRATGANVVQVCDAVKAQLPELRKLAPEGVEIGISTDFSLFIKDDIEELHEALTLGVILTALVTFLFLGTLGTTFNVCITIPASLLGTFIAIKACGFTVNFMTLLALSLSIGVVVDDAILVLENIYRRRELGENKHDAALYGSREITFSAIAATLSIVAIFFPIAFMQGAVGRFFFQFGITVSVAVLLSLVIALTVTPMLCANFLEVRHPRRPMPIRRGGWLGRPATVLARGHWILDRFIFGPLILWPVDQLMHALTWVYIRLLRVALRVPALVMLGGLFLTSIAFLIVQGISWEVPAPLSNWLKTQHLELKPIGRELVPSEDQNRFVVNVICPVGSNIDYVETQTRRAELRLAQLVDPNTNEELIAGMFATISFRPGSLITESTIFVRLVPSTRRTITHLDAMAKVRAELGMIPGSRIVVLDLSTQGFTPSRGYPIDFALQGPDWQKVIRWSENIRLRWQTADVITENKNAQEEDAINIQLGGAGYLTDIQSDYRPGMPEVQILPQRDEAASRDVSMQRLAYDLGVGTGGMRNGRFTQANRRYDVRLRYLEDQRATPDSLDRERVKTETGQLIPIEDFIDRDIENTLPVIPRYNHMRKVELTANMAPGVSQGEAIERARDIIEQERRALSLGDNYRVVQLGNSMAMAETIDSLWRCLLLGFVLAYMILGVQFNSFIHPFTVLVAVPFGVTGALATLWYFGNTLNMMSMIGMILLAGLVKKNSIILVDFTNQLKHRGLSTRAAILQACPQRLRPIIMTSLATIVGAIPLAIGVGSGSETRAPLARSIIGGSILATLVTLFIVPVLYETFEKIGIYARRTFRSSPSQPEPSA